MKTKNTHIAKTNLDKSYLIIKLFFIIFILFVNFNPNKLFGAVKEYYIECKQTEFDSIMTNYSQDIYINAKLTYNNQVWDNLQLRIRGDGTRAFPKKSLKLKFDAQPFDNGRYTLNFNSEYEDPSYIRSALSSRIFRDAGVPCYETDYAKLYINGKFIGLFNRVENVDEQFLNARGYSESGSLYKATGEGACLNTVDNILVYEKKTGSSTNYGDLVKFINDIDDASQNDYYNFAQKKLDYENMLKMIVINWLVLNGSTYYHNYYVYNNPDNNKWMMFPWDLDKTFGANSLTRKFDLSTEAYWPDNPFLEKGIWNPQVFADLKTKAFEISNTIYNKDYLYPIIDSLKDFIHETVIEDTCDRTDETKWLSAIDNDKFYINYRYQKLLLQLDSCPTAFRAFKMNPIVVGTPYFTWQTSKSNFGNQIKYKFYLSTDKYYAADKTTIIENIIDTNLTITTQLENNRVYYWKVEAIDGNFSIEGYENFNNFQYKSATLIPCDITNEYVMTKANSPYFVDCNINVHPSGSIIAQPGVEIIYNKGYQIYVNGFTRFIGTEADPIYVRGSNGVFANYNLLKNEFNTGECDFQFVNFTNVINYNYSNTVSFLNCRFVNNKQCPAIFVDTHESQFTFNNNYVKSNMSCEGVIAFLSVCQVENNYISGFYDDLEIIECTNSHIANNLIENSGDDGIDMNNCTDILIENNIIRDIRDKGITCGDKDGIGSTNITIRNNMISNCGGGGVNAKNGSSAYLINNTLYDNIYNLHANQPMVNSTPAHLTVVNCILSKPKDITIYHDAVSTVDVSYSLSDKELLAGEGNIFANPEFINVSNADFNIKSNSPCIDAGNPDTGTDADGTRKDIGCYPYNQTNYSIVINEINYNSSDVYKTDDWIELYNNSDIDVDISSWVFRDSDPSHKFIIPTNTILKKREYLILAQTLSSFKSVNPNVNNSIGDFDFGLSSQGEYIALIDKSGNIVDSLTYMSVLPWDPNANGTGATLQLISANLDNALPTSWNALFVLGTPGNANKTSSVEDMNCTEVKVFPNPTSKFIQIQNQEIADIIKIEIFNTDGKDMSSIAKIEYNGRNINLDVHNLNSGIYLIKYITNKQSYFAKFVKI